MSLGKIGENHGTCGETGKQHGRIPRYRGNGMYEKCSSELERPYPSPKGKEKAVNGKIKCRIMTNLYVGFPTFYFTIYNITRFDNHRQLIAFCGLDPTIIQSGKSINVHGTISKRGNKYARWILFNISQIVVKLGHQCPGHPVYDYYLTKKAEGKHYYENLTACSTKILRMLYTMCKNNTTFKIN